MSFTLTKKQKHKGIALGITGISVALGSILVKKKVKSMKEDGTYDRMVFKMRLSKYLKAAKEDDLTIDLVDSMIDALDRVNEDFNLDLDDDKYMDLHMYLDDYFSNLAKSNNITFTDSNNTEIRLRQCLNTQKFILESFA